MSQNLPLYGVVSAGVGALAFVAKLPPVFAVGLSIAVFGICLGISSFVKVDVPKIEPKPKKLSKKEKRAAEAAARAAAGEESEEETEEERRKREKAQRKREKERAKKEAKKAAAAKAAEEAAAKAAAEAEAAKAATGGKKKKKKKKKSAAAAAPKEEEPEKVEEETKPEIPGNWEEVKVKKGKKKVEVVEQGESVHNIDLYVERKHFGTIIGEKGSTLHKIIEATGCEIDLPKEGGIRREIIISGSVEGCELAKKTIKQLVAKGYSDLTDPAMSDSKITVPDKKLGVLIGPGGKNIKAIQEKTGVRINTPDRGSDSNEVSIVGEPAGVKQAIAAINQLLEQGYSDLTHENYITTSIEVRQDMLRTLIGPGGATIRGLQDSTKVRINVPSDKTSEAVFVTLVGEGAAVADCSAQIAQLLVPPEPTPIPEEWTQSASLQHLDAW